MSCTRRAITSMKPNQNPQWRGSPLRLKRDIASRSDFSVAPQSLFHKHLEFQYSHYSLSPNSTRQFPLLPACACSQARSRAQNHAPATADYSFRAHAAVERPAARRPIGFRDCERPKEDSLEQNLRHHSLVLMLQQVTMEERHSPNDRIGKIHHQVGGSNTCVTLRGRRLRSWNDNGTPSSATISSCRPSTCKSA